MITTALIGSPVDQSVSPALFKVYADEHGLEYAHVKFDVKSDKLETVIKSLPAYGFAGVNITLPYKSDVIPFLDDLSPEARAIGAVNTIKVSGSRLIGYNTDAFGAISAIEKVSSRKLDKSDKAIVFGTGGAARAVAWILLERGLPVTVVYREPKSNRTKSFHEDFSDQVTYLTYEALSPEKFLEYTVVCNATSAGMHPNPDDCPIDLEKYANVSFDGVVVFDAIFNPRVTRLQNWAKDRSAILAYGIDMMVFQGIVAFEYWTGKKVSDQAVNLATNILTKQS